MSGPAGGGGFLADRRDVLAITAGVALLPLIPEGEALAAALRDDAFPEGALRIGRDQPFNHGWRFLRGAGDGLESPALTDADWRSVDLPHDWSIEDLPGTGPQQAGPFTRDSKGGTATGFTIGGEGWYRKHFRVDNLPADALEQKREAGRVVLAHGEVTGHAHALTGAGTVLYASPKTKARHLKVVETDYLRHEEHTHWAIPPGIYRVVIQTEYRDKELVRVAD